MFQVLAGDCREVMATLEAESVDAIVTDPPYELGFMGKSWDASGVAFDPETWRHALRVLKPGGHLLAFSGSRTYHRMACAIEDAGFEIRDQIMWVYGSGFPKSLNLDGAWSGWGTALKPAHEPIVVARKPFKGTVAQNVLVHGTGALNIDGCRVETDDVLSFGSRELGDGIKYGKCKPTTEGIQNPAGRWPANFIHDGSDEVLRLFPDTKNGGQNMTTVRDNSSMFGVGASNGVGITNYANDSGSAARFFYCAKASKRDREDGLDGFRVASPGELTGGRKEGSAGLDSPRAGAGRTSGRSNHHPTVKPTDLMRYLCRLVTPPGGLVLDPFTGSGSTGRGAVLEGFRFIGIEMDPGYREIAIARIESAERSSHGAS